MFDIITHKNINRQSDKILKILTTIKFNFKSLLWESISTFLTWNNTCMQQYYQLGVKQLTVISALWLIKNNYVINSNQISSNEIKFKFN